jgi:pimeloyl-ACP methyl ester carboxylesterase
MNVRGLITIAGIPASGAFPVFQNWFAFDTSLLWRSIKMGGHPRAPIATPELMCRAFFSEQFAKDPASVSEVWNELESIESLAWPALLQLRFADESCISNRLGGRVQIIGGKLDRIITPDVIRKAASAYGVDPIIIDDNAHDLMLDVNWQETADVIAKAALKW